MKWPVQEYTQWRCIVGEALVEYACGCCSRSVVAESSLRSKWNKSTFESRGQRYKKGLRQPHNVAEMPHRPQDGKERREAR